MAVTAKGEGAREALLDATERVLIEEGYPAVTTRRVAQVAGLNHGLVHYYFGAVESLMVAAAERATADLIERQTAMYASDAPFLEKWRTAMQFLEADLDAGYPKLMFELSAMSWNHPEMRSVVAESNRRWRAVLGEAFAGAAREYDLNPTEVELDAVVSLAMTSQLGLCMERLIGETSGHGALLRLTEQWLSGLSAAHKGRRRRR